MARDELEWWEDHQAELIRQAKERLATLTEKDVVQASTERALSI